MRLRIPENIGPVGTDPAVQEKTLLSAILERAIADALGVTGNICQADQIRREAYEWVTRYDMDPFGFDWICEHLDLEGFQIRRFVVTADLNRVKFIRSGRGLERSSIALDIQKGVNIPTYQHKTMNRGFSGAGKNKKS